MDMETDNDVLLKQFFSDAARQQIADDGFSQRVMRQLPARTNWFVRLWTAGCTSVAVVLFVVCRGWELVTEHVLTLFHNLSAIPVSTQLLVAAATMFGLLFVGVGEVITSERRLL
jgi:hypothetical protein